MNMFEINNLYKKFIEENFDENKNGAFKVIDYINNSTAKYKGKPIYSLYMPKIFDSDTLNYLEKASRTMYNILLKVVRNYIDDENYRKLFMFDKNLERLILSETGYESLLPIIRIDIFLNEENLNFKYCEFNADGCSSMNEDRELNNALKFAPAYNKMREKYDLSSFELFNSWVDEFINIYNTYKFKKEKPFIVITDFLEKGCSAEEFEQFRKSFENAGYDCEVCEIRDFVYNKSERQLFTKSKKKVDAVYRRAVTTDIMENIDEVKDFVEAAYDGAFCMIGGFRTHIIHNKILFYILNNELTYKFLTKEEIKYIHEHIPKTVSLTENEIVKNNVLNEKDKWIIKPEDSYGARGVFAGMHYNQNEWETILKRCIKNKYILQEFVMPYRSYNIDFKKGDEFKLYSNLTGMFMYNGKLKGIYSRQSAKEIISTEHDENDIASVIARRI